ncbi:MAG: PIN domain-containing protein [Thermoplasmatota archaeon]
MFVVVDANRVFSALLTAGETFNVFLLNSLTRKIDFIAPEFLFVEIEKHIDEIIERSNLSEGEITDIFGFIEEQITPVPFKQFTGHAEKARQASPHDKDVPYFALALKTGAPIWSREKAFRGQSEVGIVSSSNLMEML